MNIEQLNSYIEKKELPDQKAISQIMLLIEKYPYFQTAHMLLLKSMHINQPEKYNGQLKISASFISDKKKLYQYIHAESIPKIVVEEKKQDKKIEKAVELKAESSYEKPVIEKEKPLIDKPSEEKRKIIEKTSVEEIKIPTTNSETIIPEEISKETDVNLIKRPEVKKKTELPEDEIERIANINSEIKHKKIVTDFFHTPAKEKIEKKIVETEIEVPKKETDLPVIEKKEFPGKQEIKNMLEEKKRNIISKNEPLKIEKEKPIIPEKEAIIPPKKEVLSVENKSVNISDNQEIAEKEKIKEKEIPEQRKEITDTNKEEYTKRKTETESTGGETSDTMSNIFSKIRQIKKEMNIETVNSHEIIDVNPSLENSKIIRTKKTEDLKGSGRVIKESFIGFEESEIKKDELIGDISKNTDVEEKQKSESTEKEEIKESGITAKDLFKQHLKNKEKNIESSSNLIEKTIETKSPISKIVESINQGEIISPIIEKEEPIINEELNKTANNQENIESGQKTSPPESENLSAADLLLKRIAEKKQKMKEEKEREEYEKLHPKTTISQDSIKEIKESVNTDSLKDEILEDNIEQEEQSSGKELTETNEPKEKKSQKLIETFIQKVDTLERIGQKETSITGDISEKSTEEKDDFMTETMADLFIQQKNYQKAIEIYNKLILKYPEKKTYFAIQIKKTESLIK